MPIETAILNKNEAIVHKAAGEITFEDIKAAYKASLKYTVSKNDMPVVWDLIRADASKILAKDIEKIAGYFSKHSKKRSHYKVALVAPRDLEYGLGRMLSVYLDNTPAEVRVFRSYEQAKGWLQGFD